jgi:hypothetical protein
MPTEKLPTADTDTPISKEEFEKRDDQLTDDLDKLEKDVFPPKAKPAKIGGMF